jgi:hypothetical protein
MTKQILTRTNGLRSARYGYYILRLFFHCCLYIKNSFFFFFMQIVYLCKLQIGVFDPYSDDPRLAVKKLCLCPVTGLLIVAGTAGQVVVAELSETQAEKEVPVLVIFSI